MSRQKNPIREPDSAAKRPTTEEFLVTAARVNRAGADFLRIDVQTALTFSGIALQSNSDEDKRRRNRKSARRGYDTILHLLEKVQLTTGEARSMSRNMTRLKSELRELGETF